MIRAMIFDCFGVLASEGWIAFRNRQFGHDDKLVEQANDAMKAISLGLMSTEEFLGIISDMSGVAPAALGEEFYHNMPNEELLNYIRMNKGNFRFGMLSNISQGRLEAIFSAEQIALFDELALSYKTGLAKPDPNAYILVAERLGVATDNCLFVDDQARNVIAAGTVGMHGIVYKNFQQFEAEIKKLVQ